MVAYRIHGFQYGSGDTAVAEQALWNTLHGEWFHQSFLPVQSNFSEHLNFSQLFFLPLYAVVTNTLTLYAVIHLCYAVAAWMLFRFVRERAGAGMGFFMLAVFLLQPVTILQNISTLHIAAVGAPLLCMTLLFYEQKKYWPWCVTMIFTTLTSEFIAPTIILLSVLAAIDRRSWKWIVPPAVFGIAMMIAAQLTITIGYANRQELLKAVKGVFTRRVESNRLAVIEGLFRPVAYLFPFLSRYLLLLLPTLALALFIVQAGRTNLSSHLFSLSAPILTFAVWDVSQRLHDRRKKIALLCVVCVALAVSVPLWFSSASLRPNRRAAEMRSAVQLVRDGGSVTASRIVSYHLARRHDFYLIDNQQLTDYIVIDMAQYEFSDRRYREYIKSISTSGRYRKIMQENKMLVYISKKKLSELLGVPAEEFPRDDADVRAALKNL